MFFTMLRLLVIVSAATLIPSIGHANPIREPQRIISWILWMAKAMFLFKGKALQM